MSLCCRTWVNEVDIGVVESSMDVSSFEKVGETLDDLIWSCISCFNHNDATNGTSTGKWL